MGADIVDDAAICAIALEKRIGPPASGRQPNLPTMLHALAGAPCWAAQAKRFAAVFLLRLRRRKPTRPAPMSIMAQVSGSGTGLTEMAPL
jgi:hypothetical protein